MASGSAILESSHEREDSSTRALAGPVAIELQPHVEVESHIAAKKLSVKHFVITNIESD